jgi:hypothetical protein
MEENRLSKDDQSVYVRQREREEGNVHGDFTQDVAVTCHTEISLPGELKDFVK